jgi:hypothetical protein
MTRRYFWYLHSPNRALFWLSLIWASLITLHRIRDRSSLPWCQVSVNTIVHPLDQGHVLSILGLLKRFIFNQFLPFDYNQKHTFWAGWVQQRDATQFAKQTDRPQVQQQQLTPAAMHPRAFDIDNIYSIISSIKNASIAWFIKLQIL